MVEQKRDTFYMRTENSIIKNYLSKAENKSEAIERILEDVLTGQLIPKGESIQGITEKERLDIQYKQKRNAKLDRQITRLDFENRLILIRQFHLSPTLALEVAEGRTHIDEVLSPDIKKQIQPDGICDFCGHRHLSEFAGGHCSASTCNCGVRT